MVKKKRNTVSLIAGIVFVLVGIFLIGPFVLSALKLVIGILTLMFGWFLISEKRRGFLGF